jgi:hypothetical protein
LEAFYPGRSQGDSRDRAAWLEPTTSKSPACSQSNHERRGRRLKTERCRRRETGARYEQHRECCVALVELTSPMMTRDRRKVFSMKGSKPRRRGDCCSSAVSNSSRVRAVPPSEVRQ